MLQTLPEISQCQADSSALRQHTLAGPVVISGKGLMLGREAVVTIKPAAPNHGIVFVRTDLNPHVSIPATVHNAMESSPSSGSAGSRRTTLRATYR
jgi:UDP-3-O-acyl-N-acetylglucosamine deacetylase